jgi:uncharacterized protein
MQFYTDAAIGRTQSLTPEGYLLCRDVVIARTGQQLYHEDELPDLEGNASGIVSVDRPAAEVFHPDSIASLAGKPIIDEHPDGLGVIGPDNWQQHAIGFVSNPRRGAPPNDDAVVADLVFTTRRGIDLVRNGKRALSVGYEATYAQTGPGRATQHDIRANHLSLVSEGRCGPRCAIGDRAMPVSAMTMDAKADAILAAVERKKRKRTTTVDTMRLMRVVDEKRQEQQRGIAARNRDFWRLHANAGN